MIQPTNMQNQYPAQGGANAVSINIFNPQAYGSTPNAQQPQQTTAPYAYTNSLYNIPTASAFGNPMALPMEYQYQGYMPANMPMNMMAQQYQGYMPANAYMPNQAPIQQPSFATPIAQPMPQSIIDQTAPVAQQPTQVVEPIQAEVVQPAQQQVVQQETPVAEPAQAAAPMEPAQVEVAQTQQPSEVVNIDALVQNLKNGDPKVKNETIFEIATCAQKNPEVALQIVSEPIMQSLVDIINEDTSALQGPTEQQIAIAQKIEKGEAITAEEKAIADDLSPRDMANKNRILSLWTLAMVQKLQRDELNQYIETQKANGQETIAPLNIQDLVGYNDVINVIKNDARPEVQAAAIQAIQHVLEPQDKAVVDPILTEAQNSTDEGVKKAATEALAKFQA